MDQLIYWYLKIHQMWLMILENCCKKNTESLLALKDARGGGYSLLWLIRGCAQGMVFLTSLPQMGCAISRKSVLNGVRVLCPKQGYKIEGFVLNRVGIFRIFLSWTWSRFQTFSGFPPPKCWSSTPSPPPTPRERSLDIVLVDDDQLLLNWLSVIYMKLESWLLRWVNVSVRSSHELFLRFFLWQIYHRWRCIVPLW